MCDALDAYPGVHEKTSTVSYQSYCPDCAEKTKLKQEKQRRKYNSFTSKLCRAIGKRMMKWGQ